MPAARAKRAVAGNFFPPTVFRARPRRVPRAAPEHGRLPMDAAARIASMNFAIAYTLIYYPIKVMADVRGESSGPKIILAPADFILVLG